jgi:chorismate synthase
MKPLATLNRPVLKTVDVMTKQESVSFKERTDVTSVPAMGVVAETMVALVLASEALRKFGGDSLSELKRNHASYLEEVREERWPSAAADPAVTPPADRSAGE